MRRSGPGGVTSGAGVGKGSRGRRCRGSDVEDCGRSEGEEVIGPFLCSKVSWVIVKEDEATDQGLRLLSQHHQR